jgi:ammonium transporter, Amt family
VFSLCNAIISGIVSITACCNSVSLANAAVIGLIGCLIYQQTKKLLYRFEIDDPLDVSQTHGICGLWGIVASGLFDSRQGFLNTGKANYLGVQLIGAVSLALWSGIMSFIFFYVLYKIGRLRLNPLFEVIGADFMEFGIGKMNTLNREIVKDLVKRQENADKSLRG